MKRGSEASLPTQHLQRTIFPSGWTSRFCVLRVISQKDSFFFSVLGMNTFWILQTTRGKSPGNKADARRLTNLGRSMTKPSEPAFPESGLPLVWLMFPLGSLSTALQRLACFPQKADPKALCTRGEWFIIPANSALFITITLFAYSECQIPSIRFVSVLGNTKPLPV